MIFLRRFDMRCGMESQMKMDARKSPAALFEIRKQIVRLHKGGTGPMAIKEQTGISWGAIRTAIDLFESGGIKALKPKCRGCKKGASRTLSRCPCARSASPSGVGASPRRSRSGLPTRKGQARGLCRRLTIIHCRSNKFGSWMTRIAV